jgi:hypothetical protein
MHAVAVFITAKKWKSCMLLQCLALRDHSEYRSGYDFDLP